MGQSEKILGNGADDNSNPVREISKIRGGTENRASLTNSFVSFVVGGDEKDSYAEEIDMPKDTFSMFEIANICTAAFLLSVIVFLFQMAIYVLIFLDLIDENTKNSFQIPNAVSWEVSTAQVLSICITAGVQLPELSSVAVVIGLSIDDILVPERFRAKGGPDMTLYRVNHVKEWVGVSVRVIESFCAAGASFLLILQSTKVIELFFNFAALQFVSFLPQLAFIIAKDGVMGMNSPITQIALTVENIKINIPARKVNQKLRFARLVVSIVFMGMMITWGVVFSKQKAGQYDCQRFSVQFADDFEVSCGLMSGIYRIASAKRLNGRLTYENKDTGGSLMYEDERWVFSGPNCKVYSTETTEYDILLVAKSGKWNVDSPYEEYNGGILSHFSLTCLDCNREREADNFCSAGTKPSSGRCVGNKCVCDDIDYDGPLCDVWNPALYCETLTAKQNRTKYKILRRKPDQDPSQFVEVYGRPVYLTSAKKMRWKNKTGEVYKVEDINGVWRFFMFLGRRWVLADADTFFGTRDINNITDILSNTPIGKVIWGEDYFEKNAKPDQLYEHAQEKFKAILSVSEPSDFGTVKYQEGPNLKMWYKPATKSEKGGFGVFGDYFLGIMPTGEKMGSKAYSCEPHCSSFYNYTSGWAHGQCIEQHGHYTNLGWQ